ncbi:unnamed protein product [Phytophthora lilii]|uniref:Unnamed protein product n=1 Tax=Phytophthora lilii TaxID=2077276 RepID=A0A9W6WQD9_9STRA|nr:unnamed protein product [Phytophthora lilii]
MKQLVPEMEQVLVEMNRAFEILVPTLDLFELQERVDEEQLMPSSDANPAVKSERKQRETLSGDDDHEHADNNDDDDDNVEWEDVSAPSIVGTEGQDEEEGVEWENFPTDVDDTRLDEQYDVDEDGDTVDPEMDINEIVQTYGLGSSSYQLTVEVSKQVCEKSSENDALFGNLADGALRMRKRFLPLLDDWEQHSTLTGPPASSSSTLEFQREVLQRIRDLRDRMTRALLKWDDLAQGSKKAKRERESAASAVVKLPLDAYDPPAKRQRQISS